MLCQRQNRMAPFFFAEATVTGITYVYTLEQWLRPQLKENFLGQLQFKQDGAPPHFRMTELLNGKPEGGLHRTSMTHSLAP
jgi:hypothetical protein